MSTTPQITWEVVETRVLNRVMVQVSRRNDSPGEIPLYSIRVGTTQLLRDGGTRVSAHMSIYDAQHAAQLLTELSEKYVDLRAQMREESKQRSMARQYRPAKE